MRWAIALGARRAGPRARRPSAPAAAFLAARAALDETRRRRTSLRIVTGVPAVDDLLDDLAPVLGAALERAQLRPSAGSPA